MTSPNSPTSPSGPQFADLEARLIAVVAQASGLAPAQIETDAPLERYGINSTMIVELSEALSTDFPDISTSLFFEHRTIAALAAHLGAEGVEAAQTPEPLTAAPRTLPAAPDFETPAPDTGGPDSDDWLAAWLPKGPKTSAAQAQPDDIAIVAMSGRYPDAPNLEQFWKNLCEGRDSVTEVPQDRWDMAQWFDPDPEREDRVYAKWGGFLEGIDKFDARFFNVSPREAKRMDPQERLFLQEAWQCLEGAGYKKSDLAGSRTGVFVGAMWSLYQLYGAELTAGGTPDAASSNFATIANRLSWFLDLNGPSLTVDTMCSSALTALALAMQALRAGACDQALVGGVNLCVHPAKYLHLSRGSFAARDGKCRAFGAGGSGYVPGEGVGVVLLKPLAQARAAGDEILAVIKACEINHGGNTHGYTVPSPSGQNAAIDAALRASGVAPEAVRYVEAHGTGTALGDPIEVEGLLRSYGQGAAPLRVGSVKSNIGHLEAAAGMAGLHKLILQMQHQTLVPSLHTEELNPNIDWSRLNVEVQRSCEAFSLAPQEAMALSAFGAGGSNAHLVLAPGEVPVGTEERLNAPDQLLPFVVSAADDAVLRRHLQDLRDWLKTPGDRPGAAVDLAALAATLAHHRDPMPSRFAAQARSRAALLEQIQAFLDGKPAKVSAELAAWIGGADQDLTALVTERSARRFCPPRPFVERSFWLAAPCGPKGVGGQPSTQDKSAVFAGTWRELPPGPLGPLGLTPQAQAPDRILATPEAMPLAHAAAGALGLTSEAVLPLDAGTSDRLGSATRVLLLSGDDSQTEALLSRSQWLLQRAQRRVGFDCLHVAIAAIASPLAQLLRLLPAEQGFLRTASIAAPAEISGDRIATLWAQFADGKLPVCATLRSTETTVQRLEFDRDARAIAAPDPAGWHIITGGTGGIGLRLAAHLAAQGVTRLILTGRRPLPARVDWAGILADPTADPNLCDKLRRLQALPPETRIVQWDIEDADALRQQFDALTQEAPLSLVVHLAGVVDDPSLALVDKEDGAVSRVFGAKLRGARALAAALPAQARLLLVSSQSAVVPKLATGVLDYAMANGALNDLALNSTAAVQSLMLPNWRGAGFGDADTPQLRKLGLPAVGDDAGLGFFDNALRSPASVFLAAGLGAGFDLGSLCDAPPRAPRKAPAPTPAPALGLTLGLSPARQETQPQTPRPEPAEDLIAQMAARFAPVLDLAPEEWDPTERFGVLGVDSVLLTRLGRKLEEIIGTPVAADVMIEHDTLQSLAAWVQETHMPAAKPLPPEPQAADLKPASAEPAPDQGIAIVGIGTVLPGAETVAEYWSNLLNGRDLIREVPADRWPVEALYDPKGAAAKGREGVPSKWGAFVEDLAHFDATEFGLPAGAGEATDPLVRLALWATRGALADAGLTEAEMRGAKAGVFLGSRVANWADRLPDYHRESVLGTAQNFIAAHICHWLDLNGPAVVVDTACSSSLYATHLACASLRLGECDIAFAGGSECLLDERPYQMLGRTGAMSPTGRCRTFDAAADGFVPGEGAVTLVLKRLEQAQADGDRIYAVIEGSAVNNDGRTMGVTTPNPERQKDVIRQAMAQAGARADDITYMEAHGTGTALGDPMELRGLTEVFAETGTAAVQGCAIGSVKSNIGHLLSTAGASGLAKVALQLHHQMLVPTLHCDQPNPRFSFETSPFYPVLQAQPFAARGALRRAGISGFGFGGTNVHIQLSDRQTQSSGQRLRQALPVPPRGGPYLWHARPDTDADRNRGAKPALPAQTPDQVPTQVPTQGPAHVPAPQAGSPATVSTPSPNAGFQLVRTN